MASTPKLVYWRLHGRALPIRLAARIGRVELQDEFWTFEEFKERKETLTFGQLPLLKIGEAELAQSNAILMYIGKLGGLLPSEPLMLAETEELLSFAEDFYGKITPSMKESDSEKRAAMRKELNDEVLPRLLGYLERWVTNHPGRKFFVSNQLGLAEFKIYAVIYWLRQGHLDGIAKDIVEDYPRLMTIFHHIDQHKDVKHYMEHPGF